MEGSRVGETASGASPISPNPPPDGLAHFARGKNRVAAPAAHHQNVVAACIAERIADARRPPKPPAPPRTARHGGDRSNAVTLIPLPPSAWRRRSSRTSDKIGAKGWAVCRRSVLALPWRALLQVLSLFQTSSCLR